MSEAPKDPPADPPAAEPAPVEPELPVVGSPGPSALYNEEGPDETSVTSSTPEEIPDEPLLSVEPPAPDEPPDEPLDEHSDEPLDESPDEPLPAALPPPTPEPPDAWDRATTWLIARGPLPALALLTLLVGALFAGVFRGEVIGDDLTFHMAEARRIADCLRDGDFDFWNPSANGGFASLYYYQAIPQLAAALPAALFGNFLFWFQLSVFLPHVLAPAAAYRGARLLGATPWQSFAAALAVAMISGQSRWGTGADGTFQVGLYTQTWALAAFPLALGHGARWISSGRGLPAAIAWGAFVTLCHPFAGISLGLVLVVGVAAQLAASLAHALGDRRIPIKEIVLALCIAGVGLHVALLIVKWRLLYAVPLSLFAAVSVRLGWEIATGYRSDRPPPLRILLHETPRLAVLGVTMLLAAMPVWLTVAVDYDGFGGFPHRVNDEVGPGYTELMRWQVRASILDFQRPAVLTWMLPAVVLLARAAYLRWLWLPALAFAALLAAGPHMPKTADDLLPAVRFLGAMQVVLAMGIGAGAIAIGAWLWRAPQGTSLHTATRVTLYVALIGVVLSLAYGAILATRVTIPLAALDALTFGLVPELGLRFLGVGLVSAFALFARPAWRFLGEEYGPRTGLSVLAMALVITAVVPGGKQLSSRVRVLEDYGYRGEMLELIDAVAREPQGRKQVGSGTENHWWNLLSYAYARRPALLQMGGGGLQASPNYDFVWSVRDFPKLAWVYDTPYFLFARTNASTAPAGEVVAQTKNYELRRLPAPGVVSPIQITGALPPGRKEARAAGIAWLRTDMGLGNRHLAYAGHGFPGAPPDATVLRAGRTTSPGAHSDLFAEVSAARPSTFVFRESWHPRWRAFIDGAPAPIRRVTPDFPAIDVPEGRHLLQLRFERPWWAHAAWLAWPGLPLLAWLALLGFSRFRRRPPATST